MRNWFFGGDFFSTIKMVKLWGGVSSILIEGVRPTFIHLLILLIFIDFIDFLSILLIFIDFITRIPSQIFLNCSHQWL